MSLATGVAEARTAALRRRLAEHELDALLVTRIANVRYLCGFTGSNGALLVTAAGQGPRGELLVTDSRYSEQADAEAADVAVGLVGGGVALGELLAEHLGQGLRLGLESHDVTWERLRALEAALAGQAELLPAGRLVEELRAVKDATELAALRGGCALVDAALDALFGWLAPGRTEREVAARLEAELRDRGAEAIAFETIVAAGPNAARPHHRPDHRRLVAGDVVVIDVGADVEGYHSDMTRTVALGEPAAELAAVHGIVERAQAAGRTALAAGVTAGAIDDACRSVIAEAGYAERFVHATGHGVGLEVHEEPVLRAGSTATLPSGCAVTVEPGIYLPAVGGVRIEDVVAVTDDGAEPLGAAPRHLVRL